MPESVAACRLRDPGAPDGFLDGTLQNRLVEVVTAPLAGLGLHVDPRRREDPLPRPLPSRFGILASQRRGKLNPVAGSALGNLFPLLIHGEGAPHRWPSDKSLTVTTD